MNKQTSIALSQPAEALPETRHMLRAHLVSLANATIAHGATIIQNLDLALQDTVPMLPVRKPLQGTIVTSSRQQGRGVIPRLLINRYRLGNGRR